MGGDRLLVGREEKFGGKGIFLGGGMSKFSDGGGGGESLPIPQFPQ